MILRLRTWRRLVIASVGGITLAALGGLVILHEPQPRRITGSTMGAPYAIIYRSGPPADVLQTKVEALLDIMDLQLSNWRDDSWLHSFNQHQGSEPMPVPEHPFDVLRLALHLAERTDGAFDPTLGRLTEIWGFGPHRPRQLPPSAQDLAVARTASGYQKLRLHDAPPRVSKKASGLALDVSGLAKGYAADQLAELLRQHGIKHFLIKLGGDMRAQGQAGKEKDWRVLIEMPDAPQSRQAYAGLTLHNQGLATSGDYRRFTEIDGYRRPHILDPRSGEPVENRLASATVLAPTAAMADALATACMVLGREAAIHLIENTPDVELLLIERIPDRTGRFEHHTSSGWPGFIEKKK